MRTIVDLAKHVFQVHGIDVAGEVIIRKKLRRSEVKSFFAKLPPCLVGMEACGTAHHWGRELSALGHEVRLMPVGYVKPYIKRGKNDEVDAEAICEAVTRPTMRFVPIKSTEQQAVLMLHRTRDLLVPSGPCSSTRCEGSSPNSGWSHRKEFGVSGSCKRWLKTPPALFFRSRRGNALR